MTWNAIRIGYKQLFFDYERLYYYVKRSHTLCDNDYNIMISLIFAYPIAILKSHDFPATRTQNNHILCV